MSPIIGFTDDLKPRFPRLGKLRKGGERIEKARQDGSTYLTYGEDLPYFRFTGENAEITQAFITAHNAQPDELRVFMAYPTPGDAFPVWAELWGATGMVHRCDGKNMTIWLEDGKYVAGSKACPGGHKDGDPTRDAIGRLHLILPELLQAGHVGHVTLETHSKNDIVNILSVLMETYTKAGDLTGVAFLLKRVKVSISTPGFGAQAGKRSKVDKWLVRLEPEAAWVRKQLSAAYSNQMALPEGPIKADPETGEVIDAPAWEVVDEQQPATTPAQPAAAEPPPPAAQQPAKPPAQKPDQYRQAQPPKNGAKPANGNGQKKRPDTDKPSKEDLTKFDELCTEAEALHIDVSSIIASPYEDTLGSLRGAFALVKELIEDAKQPAQPEEPPVG